MHIPPPVSAQQHRSQQHTPAVPLIAYSCCLSCVTAGCKASPSGSPTLRLLQAPWPHLLATTQQCCRWASHHCCLSLLQLSSCRRCWPLLPRASGCLPCCSRQRPLVRAPPAAVPVGCCMHGCAGMPMDCSKRSLMTAGRPLEGCPASTIIRMLQSIMLHPKPRGFVAVGCSCVSSVPQQLLCLSLLLLWPSNRSHGSIRSRMLGAAARQQPPQAARGSRGTSSGCSSCSDTLAAAAQLAAAAGLLPDICMAEGQQGGQPNTPVWVRCCRVHWGTPLE